MDRYHLIVSGKVQGVGFRFFVCQKAKALSLTGWVRNCSDNTVEIEIQGDQLLIKEFIKSLNHGNGFSKTHDIEATKIDLKTKEKDFKVSY